MNNSQIHYLLMVSIFLPSIFFSCTGSGGPEDAKPVNRTPSIAMETHVIIGEEKEGAPILGEPIAVRTDEAGNIYIADRASLTVKVYDEEGAYLKSLGGRGRGPHEFYDINFMERTPEGNFFFLDRGNLRYTTLTKDGEFVSSHTINLQNQFYVKGLAFLEDKYLALYLSAALINPNNPKEHFSRNFLHIRSPDMQTSYASFAPFHHTGIEETFGYNQTSRYNGSFTVAGEQVVILSPGIYTGSLYVYKEKEEFQWELAEVMEATASHAEPFISYKTEEQYERAKHLPGATWSIFSGNMGRGKLNSFDAGIFYLLEREQIIHFYAEWREGNVTLEDGNLLDISMQLLDMEGNVLAQSYLLSMEYGRRSDYTLVNWMDEEGYFYLLDYSNGEPTVRKFSLELP